MNALAAYAMATLRREDPRLAKLIRPASDLVAPDPYDFVQEIARRSAAHMQIGRAAWRYLQAAQLDLFAGLPTRSGPKQLCAPPARPLLRRATPHPGKPESWSWRDAVINP